MPGLVPPSHDRAFRLLAALRLEMEGMRFLDPDRREELNVADHQGAYLLDSVERLILTHEAYWNRRLMAEANGTDSFVMWPDGRIQRVEG
jgi:hypothetical protein